MDDNLEAQSPRRPWARYLAVIAVVALIAATFAIMVPTPVQAATPTPSPTPSAAGSRHELYLGTVGLSIQTTNPLQYTLVDEYYIVGGVYSFLVNYGPNWEYEPDLAVSWYQLSSNPSVWNLNLTHNAYWVDPRNCAQDSNGHLQCPSTGGSFPAVPVKASDVKFTFDYVKRYANQTSYFATCVESISHVTVLNDYTVQIAYIGPYAPAIAGSITCVPILPQYIWSPGGVDQKPTWANALPIGSGPYMVRPQGTTFAMVTPPPLILDRNPLWHGQEVTGRQVFADTIFFESYTTSGAMSLDLTLGKIDMALGPNSQDYLSFLNNKPGITRQAMVGGFEAEQAVNVLTDDMRSYFAATTTRPLNLGHTNPVLLNQVVRTALHIATNRSKMIQNALGGLAEPGDTVAPSNGPLWLAEPPFSMDDKNGDGNPFDFPPFAPTALEQFPEDPQIARTMLVQAGWRFVCSTGALQTGTEFPLCQSDTGQLGGKMINALSFSFSTFNTEPWWETAARGVIADAAAAGIQLNLQLLNGSQMYNLWYRLDYEVWLWDWVWTPVTDISTLMVVQTCHGIATLDNDNGFCLRDPVNKTWTFDNMYNDTLHWTDPVARKALSDQMSNIIYGYASYNLPFYRKELYAMDSLRFTGWGDFNQHTAIPPDVGNSPLLGEWVYPVDDKPPQFSLSNFQGVAGQPVQFSVAAIDPQGGTLSYRWDFDTSSEPGGTGVNADGITWNDDQGGNSPTASHTYATPGTYGIELRVSGPDFFTTQKAMVTINPAGSGTPTVSALSFSPFDPTTYTGDLVTLAAAASDPAGTAIAQYSWNWGDGSAITTTTGPTASHQYTTPGTYTAMVTATNVHGSGSTSTIVPVSANVAPVVAPLQSQAVVVSTSNSYVAFASDANVRDVLSYSWNFGDGGTATGDPVFHTYASTGTYTLTVSVSDGHGHTVPSSTSVNVLTTHNTAPNINSFTATPSSTFTTLPVTLTANVSDAEGNPLNWSWDLNGDGVPDVVYITPQTAPGDFVVKTQTYLYTTAGTVKPKLTIFDYPLTGGSKSTFTTVTITVTLNHAPTLTPLAASPSVGIMGQGISLSSTSADVDGDRLTYTWNFGDGTGATGTTGFGGGALSAQHAYATEGIYVAVVSVNDGKGGTAAVAVQVNVTAPGFLRVTTNPALASKIFVDGQPADEWGLIWVKAAPGTHTISFGDTYGFGTPTAQTVTVTAGATTTVQGNYAAEGSLRVITNPALPSTISVNGNPSDDWGMWRSAAAGTYVIHFGAVAGWDPPADQTVTVTAGLLTTVTGNFVANPAALGPDPSTYGMLRVTTNPAVAAQVLVNGIPRDEWGLVWVKLAPGTYTVSFRGVYGVSVPLPQTVTIAAGATTTYNAILPAHGSLRILTNPALAATVFVNGVPRDDWGMWQSMLAGTYTVSFGPYPGYVTPAAQTATVSAGSLTTITGSYVLAPLASPALASSTPTLTSLFSSSGSASASSAGSSVAPRTASAPEAAAWDGRLGWVRPE